MIQAATYTTRQGDVLDDVVSRFYGDTSNGIVELVLEINRGLADYGPVLPAGVDIILPARPAQTKTPLKRLWS